MRNFSHVAFNPQPEPPADFSRYGFNPQPDPPAFVPGFTTNINPGAQLGLLLPAVQA